MEKPIESRFLAPQNFARINYPEKSFAQYLRQLPLKPHGSEVKLFDGRTKPNYKVYDAVVDLEIGHKDLHQCADAVMRLRSEFLWQQGLYEKIHFNFTNGFRVDYTEWMKGRRIIVNGNKTSWNNRNNPSNTYADFWKYMETIFMYAGTLSLAKELNQVSMDEMEIGDVFIKGGSPGHAVIVVDMAINPVNGKKIFMLAQSYMPAQEIQILQNPGNKKISPWYETDPDNQLRTPEWTFHTSALKRFGE